MNYLNINFSEAKNHLKNSEGLDNEIKERLINFMDKIEYSDRMINDYTIESIKIFGDDQTEYPGFKFEISKKPITFVLGEYSSGKTSSFDKIMHLFTSSEKIKSPIYKKNSHLEINLASNMNKGERLQIIFNSKKIKENEQFKVIKFKEIFEKTEIIDPKKLLKKLSIIDNEFNFTRFIPDNPKNSFVSIYASKIMNFKKLFRLPETNKLLEKISDEKNVLNGMMNKLETQKRTLNDKNVQISKLNKKYSDSKKETEFWIQNEEDLINSSKIFEDLSIKSKKAIENSIKAIRSNERKITDLRKEKKVIEIELLKSFESKEDIFYNKELKRTCYYCDSIIPVSVFKDRIKSKPSVCWTCGFGLRDYKDDLSIIEVPNLDPLRSRLKEINEKIIELSKSEKIDKAILKSEISKPENIKQQIWKKVVAIDTKEIPNEISMAKSRIKEINKSIETIEKEFKNIEIDIKPIDKELEKLKAQKLILEDIENKLFSKYEENYQSFIENVIDDINQAYMNLANEKGGEIYYDKSGSLNLKTEMKSDLDKIVENHHNYNSPNSDLGTSQYRKLDFAFLSSILKNTQNFDQSVRFVLIDGLHHLKNEDSKNILDGLASVPNLKIIVFDINEPDYLDPSIFDKQLISRNPKMEKPKKLAKMNKQKSLNEFFISK